MTEIGANLENNAENTQPVEQVRDLHLRPPALDAADVLPAIEALLFANGEALEVAQIAGITGGDEALVKQTLLEIKQRYASEQHGFELVEVAEKFQFRTQGRFGQYVRELKAEGPRRLSTAALETLAIVAYRQPVVKSDIEQIRGVDVTPTLKTLLERNLVRIVGHQPTVGQPALYGTTEEFLKLFGLRSLAELPTLRDIRELEQAPSESPLEETNEAEAVPAAVEAAESDGAAA